MGLTLVHFQKYWLWNHLQYAYFHKKNEDSKKNSNTGCEGRTPKQNPRGKAKKTAMMMPALLPLPTLAFIHSVYIRSVSSQSQPLLSTLLTQFKLVHGMFGQSNMHRPLDFCFKMARKELNVKVRPHSSISWNHFPISHWEFLGWFQPWLSCAPNCYWQ